MWAAHTFWVHSLQTYQVNVETSRFLEHVEHSVCRVIPRFYAKLSAIHRVPECVQLWRAHMTIGIMMHAAYVADCRVKIKIIMQMVLYNHLANISV